MSAVPGWLPPELILPSDYLDQVDALWKEYNKSIANAPIQYDGQAVQFNMNRFDDGKPECFWHLVGQGTNRSIDPARATRLPWLRAVIEHAADPTVLKWDGPGSGGSTLCRYLWLKSHNYFVVLAPGRKGGWFLVTAHYVEGRFRRHDLQKRYDEAVSRGLQK